MSCSAKNAVVEILGDKLRKKGGDGEVATASICGEGKYVGLYFAAYRLPLCQKFTSELDTFYSRLRKERGDVLEIVFVSSDENEDEFEHYYREMMHWLALPYKQRDKKKQLCRKFRVRMVPKLIILDSQTGEVVCDNGREAVITDSQGITFPWKKKPFTEVIPGNFIDRQMKTVTMDTLKDKVLGIYFSAHWCRKFTPELVFTYNKIKEAGHSFEILFASLDRGEDSFKEYLNDMPWLAIPYGEDRIRELSQLFSVESIPMLVIIDAQGHVITTEGRSCVQKDPDGEDFPWYPPPCHEVDSFSVNVLQRGPCLVHFTEMEEEDGEECTTKALELMKPIAEEIIAAENEKGYEPACEFCVAGDDDMVERLQQYLSIADESRPLLVLTDLPMLRASHCEGKEITPDLIREFYKKFVNEELEWTALS